MIDISGRNDEWGTSYGPSRGTCDHDWEDQDDDLATPGTTTVVCRKCKAPGQLDDITGEVFWPAT